MSGSSENREASPALAPTSSHAVGKAWLAESGDRGLTPGSDLHLPNGLCECGKDVPRVPEEGLSVLGGWGSVSIVRLILGSLQRGCWSRPALSLATAVPLPRLRDGVLEF